MAIALLIFLPENVILFYSDYLRIVNVQLGANREIVMLELTSSHLFSLDGRRSKMRVSPEASQGGECQH